MHKYTHIQEVSENRYTSIKVETKYQKESWSEQPRGIYLNIQPMVVTYQGEWMTESYQHGTGVKYLVKQLNRKSDKMLRSINEQLQPQMEHIATLFKDKKREEIKSLISKLTEQL